MEQDRMAATIQTREDLNGTGNEDGMYKTEDDDR
jgi:hypothetical protein